MPIDLAGKPIIITGASSGIGAATAIECAKVGMPVVIGARRADKLAHVLERVKAVGGRAIAFEMDVQDPAACKAMIQRCVHAFGSVYAVYANAGYGEEIGMSEMTDQQLRRIFETNFFGSLNIIRPALDLLRAQPATPNQQTRGHILICSSCVARLSLPYYGAYTATKAAQHHIGRSLRLELEPENIAVTTIHPIGTKTEFFKEVEKRANGAKLLEHSPDLFMQTPEFVARKTLAALRRPHAEVWPGFSGKFVRFGMSVCSNFPGIGDFFLRGMVRRRRQARSTGTTGTNTRSI